MHVDLIWAVNSRAISSKEHVFKASNRDLWSVADIPHGIHPYDSVHAQMNVAMGLRSIYKCVYIYMYIIYLGSIGAQGLSLSQDGRPEGNLSCTDQSSFTSPVVSGVRNLPMTVFRPKKRHYCKLQGANEDPSGGSKFVIQGLHTLRLIYFIVLVYLLLAAELACEAAQPCNLVGTHEPGNMMKYERAKQWLTRPAPSAPPTSTTQSRNSSP